MAGCTVESSSMAYHFGDEVRFGVDTQALDDGNYQEFGTWVTEHFAPTRASGCVNNCWIGFSRPRLRKG